jgi:hypothetical protein
MAIPQNGLTYAENHFDRERYEQVRVVAAEMMAEQSETDDQKVIDLFSGEVGYATPKVAVRPTVTDSRFRGGYSQCHQSCLNRVLSAP